MHSTEEVLRAQARALIEVLKFYRLDCGDDQVRRLWQAVEEFGEGIPGSRSLTAIHLDFYDVAFAAGVSSPPSKACDCLTLALFGFCENKASYRYREPTKLIASAVALDRDPPMPIRQLEREVLERLEEAFDANIFATERRVNRRSVSASTSERSPAKKPAQVSLNGFSNIEVRQLKLTAALYATCAEVGESVRTIGQLPAEINMGGGWVRMNHLIRTRGTDILLRPHEQLIFDAIIRSRRLPGGSVILVPPKNEKP